MNTASLESVPGANLLNDLGFTDVLGLKTKYGLPASGIPSDALNEAHHMTHDPIVIVILLNILMIVLHTMLEGISTILVLMPVILPLMKELHIDPIVFGIILAQNSALGLLFPPLGFNLYVISSLAKIPVERVAVAVLPFVAILCVDILLLIFLPQIATFLPGMLR